MIDTIRAMNHAKAIRLGAALAATLLLGACQSVSAIEEAIAGGNPEDQQLYGPVKGPELAVPPEYNLRPPVNGSDSSVPAQAARKRVFSLPTATPTRGSGGLSIASIPGKPSAGEQALLQRAGIASVNPQVRRQIDAEAVSHEKSQEQFDDKLLKWEKQPPPSDSEADVKTSEGAVVEEQAVEDVPPVTIRKKEGLLQSIF